MPPALHGHQQHEGGRTRGARTPATRPTRRSRAAEHAPAPAAPPRPARRSARHTLASRCDLSVHTHGWPPAPRAHQQHDQEHDVARMRADSSSSQPLPRPCARCVRHVSTLSTPPLSVSSAHTLAWSAASAASAGTLAAGTLASHMPRSHALVAPLVRRCAGMPRKRSTDTAPNRQVHRAVYAKLKHLRMQNAHC